MANRRWESNRLHSFHAMLAQIDCSFTVKKTDTGGKGLIGLVGAGIQNVFMNTNQTPAAGSPNPAAGYIWLQLDQNYSQLYDWAVEMTPPASGSDLVVTAAGAALTVGVPYTITALGTTTAGDWTTLGVPAGVTPALGVTFIAKATGAGTGSGKVQTMTLSGVQDIELLPGFQLALANSNVNGGGILIFKLAGPTNSTTTTLIPTAPADGSIIRIKLELSNSSVKIKGS